MNIEVHPIKSLPSFGKDYVDRVDSVLDRFDYDPIDPECWQQRASWLDEQSEMYVDKKKVADVLVRYNHQIGNSEQAIKNIERYAQGKAWTVVGGQQACLFTGPMFVIYKAIAVIQTARKLEAELKRPVIPIFWIAGEDHDWQEVNELCLPSNDMEAAKFELPIVPHGKQLVTNVSVEREHWQSALDQMREHLIDTEFSAGLFDNLHEIVRHSHTIVECFARMLAHLFGDAGLVMLDSGDPALRSCESQFFSLLIKQNDRFAQAFERGTAEIVQIGYEPQAAYSPESAHLFYVHEGERLALVRDGDTFKTSDGDRVWSMEQLNQLVHDAPEHFSNNVISRPLMQEALFPVLAVVLGKSEIAYWGQLKELFHSAGMRIPPIISRPEITIVERTIGKQLRKFGWKVSDVIQSFDEKREAWLIEHDDLELDKQFSSVKSNFLQMYEPLLQQLTELHPGLDKLGQKNKQKIIEQIAFLEKRAQDALANKHEVALRQMKRMKDSIHPLNRPQERVHNIIYYLNKYGSNWLHELLHIELEPGRHYALYF